MEQTSIKKAEHYRQRLLPSMGNETFNTTNIGKGFESAKKNPEKIYRGY